MEGGKEGWREARRGWRETGRGEGGKLREVQREEGDKRGGGRQEGMEGGREGVEGDRKR